MSSNAEIAADSGYRFLKYEPVQNGKPATKPWLSRKAIYCGKPLRTPIRATAAEAAKDLDMYVCM